MILENSDKLKDWLSVVLEPLCDADSSALARYVIALLKKDKSDKDLKRIMIEQLDVFLSEETTRFVERLFDAIASEEYLTMPHPLPTLPAVPAATSVSELDLGDELALAIDGAADIEAVLAAASPPPAKENVIKVEKQQLTDEQRPDAVAQESINLASDSTTDATTSTKPPVDHKTKDPSCPQPQSQLGSAAYHHHPPSHHQHHQVPRSASPPGRSSGGGSGGGPGPAAGYADKENQPRDGRRRRASLRSRSRSRSRSNERNFRRSRSRDRRINEREKNQRQFRNKSPPGHGSNHGRRNFDRRRIGGGGGSGGIGGGGSGGGNNIEERQRFGQKSRRSHSRSLSPERNSRRPQSSPERGGGLSSIATGNSMEPQHPAAVVTTHIRQRCRDFDEKGYCVRGETCPWDHGINPVVFEGINNSALMMSMREYNPDAPEIWARGGGGGVAGGPPGPPGPNVAGPTPSGVQGVPVSINPFSGNVRPNALMTPNHPMGVPNPSDYARPPGPQGPQGPTMMPFPFNPTAVTTPLQRQLIPIPVVDAGGGIVGGAGGGGGAPPSGGPEMGKRRFELEDTVAIADVPTKRKVPINSRLGPRVNPNMQQHNSSLELRKVPRGLNTIAHLNNHFAKFGKIVNIQVSYEGDPEAAIVTFSTHAEANVAYRSTEAVLNNRFIKVFWHNGVAAGGLDESQGNALTSGIGSNAPGGRKNASQYHLHNVPAVPTPIADGAKISNAGTTPLAEHAGAGGNQATAPTEQALAVAPASMRLKLNTTTTTTTTSSNGGSAGLAAPGTGNAATPRANAATLRKKQEEQQKAMHQLANGLRKRKQELLQSYVKQMKTALELVERMDQQDAQRAPTLETIKVLQETIDKLRKDVHADQDQLQAQIQQQQIQPSVKKTKEQQKKELLDMELELFAQQQEGNDTTALQKRLEELQRTLSAGGGGGVIGGVLNSNNPKASGPTGGGAAARKRANFPEGSTRVDRRPKAIVVTGFAAEEADFVLGHFKNFGEILKHDVDREIPQLILSYATRINAEQAVLRGKMYKEKRLQISWAPVVTTTTPAVAAPMAAPADKSPAVASVDNNLNNTTNPKQLIQSVSESESLLGSDTLPELRLEDEEEDEESEDRSWRR